jgi:hypothetical protein
VTVKGATNNNMYYRGYDLIEGWDHFWTALSGTTSDTPVMNTFYFYSP